MCDGEKKTKTIKRRSTVHLKISIMDVYFLSVRLNEKNVLWGENAAFLKKKKKLVCWCFIFQRSKLTFKLSNIEAKMKKMGTKETSVSDERLFFCPCPTAWSIRESVWENDCHWSFFSSLLGRFFFSHPLGVEGLWNSQDL